MKYFTRRFDDLSELIDHIDNIENDEGTASFSEAVYYELYNEQLNDFITMMEQDGKEHNTKTDNAETKEEFDAHLKRISALLKEYLPADVMERIPDARTLALGFAARSTMDVLDEYYNSIYDEIEQTSENYEKHCQELKKTLPKDKKVLFELFYMVINTAGTDDDDFAIVPDYEINEEPYIRKLTFRNFSFEKQEVDLNNSFIKYSELYCNDDGYEMHIYAVDDEGAGEVIITASDIRIEVGK